MAGRGDAAKAGGEVDSVTEDGVVEAFFGTHATGHDGAGGDADTDFEGHLSALVELAASHSHGEGASNGALGIVRSRFGGAEKDHDQVSDKFVDRAAVLVGDLGERSHVVIQEVDDLMGWQLLAHGGKTPNVTEEHGDLLLDASKIVAVVNESLSDGGVCDGTEH